MIYKIYNKRDILIIDEEKFYIFNGITTSFNSFKWM